MSRFRKFSLGREGAFPGRSPTQSDPYRQFDPTYRGGTPPSSGPKGPPPQSTHVFTSSPILIANANASGNLQAQNSAIELTHIKTPNVRSGQLLVSIVDRFPVAPGDNDFDFVSAEISIFGFNSGIKQLLKRQWVRNSTGPMRWVWTDDVQYDELRVEGLPFVMGMEPAIAAGILGNLFDLFLTATVVFRYVTTTPQVPQYDKQAGS